MITPLSLVEDMLVTADELIGIQEDLPNEDDRAALGRAAHYLRKYSAPTAQQVAQTDMWMDRALKAEAGLAKSIANNWNVSLSEIVTDAPDAQATCYIERSKVREILIGHNAATQAVLPKIDALPIFTPAASAQQPTERQQPDWPPRVSAVGLPDGEQRHGSTGQLFEVKNGQWVVRVPLSSTS